MDGEAMDHDRGSPVPAIPEPDIECGVESDVPPPLFHVSILQV
jgi:hypothetical protein